MIVMCCFQEADLYMFPFTFKDPFDHLPFFLSLTLPPCSLCPTRTYAFTVYALCCGFERDWVEKEENKGAKEVEEDRVSEMQYDFLNARKTNLRLKWKAKI